VGSEFGFPLPSALGLTPDWKPHTVMSDHLLAIGYFPEQTARLLQSPPKPEQSQSANSDSSGRSSLFGPAGETERATSGLLYFDNNQLATALEAWLKYGFEQAKANGESLDMAIAADSGDLNLSEQELRETLATAFNFYRSFAGFSSRTYRQENASVRHFLLKFSDR
jgi:hypothetical protein